MSTTPALVNQVLKDPSVINREERIRKNTRRMGYKGEEIEKGFWGMKG